MRALEILFDPEGNSDYELLPRVATRMIDELCLAARGEVLLGEPRDIREICGRAQASRPERCRQAIDYFKAVDAILFIHADGGSDQDRIRREQIAPVVAALGNSGKSRQGVGIVPVKEMEAWALADTAALGQALGCVLQPRALQVAGHQAPADQIADPKAVLHRILESVIGARMLRRHGIGGYLRLIGDGLDLRILRQLAAFVRLEADTRLALQNLGVIPAQL
jgi:hypothetical protein